MDATTTAEIIVAIQERSDIIQRLDAIEITLICLGVIFALTFIRNLLFSSRYK